MTSRLLGPSIVIALALSACSSGSGSTGTTTSGAAGAPAATISIGSLYEPKNLDNTAAAGQGINEAFNGNVYEGLFRLTDQGKVEQLLATDHKVSDDGLTYTVTIRDGVKFHGGRTMTSEDVKKSVERVIAPESQSARKSQLAVISSIATPDPKTVVFTLKQRSISFVYNLTYVWVVDTTVPDLKTAAGGTGPYTLGAWQRGSTLTLKPFDGYWGSKPKNAGVTFRYFTDANGLSNALLTNQVDVITSIQSPDALTRFSSNQAYKVTEGTSTTKELLAFNDRTAPFDKVPVRKAIYSAIDTKKLLNSIWGDHGKLIGSMVPPTDPWFVDLTGENPYDPARAKTLLAEGGYPNGFEFTLDSPTYDPHPAVAEFVKSELAKVGVTVRINPITADTWYSKVFKEKNFQATLQEHVNDRDIVWYGNPDFYWGYHNPQVVQWVKEAEQSATEADQTAKLKQVNEQIAKDAASVWLFLYPQITVASSKVSGYPVNGLNSQFYVYNISKG